MNHVCLFFFFFVCARIRSNDCACQKRLPYVMVFSVMILRKWGEKMTQGSEHILLEEQQFWKHRIHQIDQEEDKSTAAGLLYDIFRQALERKASDIHLEPQRDGWHIC